MISNYEPCLTCPLRDCPPVLGVGPKNAPAVIGEAPGATEVVQKKPFVGVSGQLLRTTLDAVGVGSENVYYTNVCLCRPPDNKTPSQTAQNACADRLMRELYEVSPTKILTVGGIATSALLSPGKTTAITKVRGQGMMWKHTVKPHIGETDIEDEDETYLVPTFHPAAVTRTPDLFRDFSADIQKWFMNFAPLPAPETTNLIAGSIESAIEYLGYLKSATVVSCDLETSGFDFLQGEIFSVGFGAIDQDNPLQGINVIIPFEFADTSDVTQAILDLVHNPKNITVFHNCKFDLQFFQSWLDEDFEPANVADTMLMQYARDERGSGDANTGRGFQGLGLKDQARIRYDIPDYHFNFDKFLEIPYDERPWETLYTYHAMDCYCTVRLYFDLISELMEESPKLLSLVNNVLVPGACAFAQIEREGFPISIKYFEKQSKKLIKELEGCSVTLKAIAEEYGVEDLNPASPVQIKKVMAGMKVILESTERDFVNSFLKRHPKLSKTVKQFLTTLMDYRQKSKVLQTYMTGLLERQVDGRVHPDFLLTGADTGRLSCRDPNLQNIPILMGRIVRDGFEAPEGYMLAEGDYSQLELRVVAWYSRDLNMTAIFRTGRDIHREVAAAMFKKPAAQITQLERYMAKYVDFGIIYGRGARSLAEGWEMDYVVEQGGTPWTLKEAEEFLSDFLNGFPGLRDWIDRQHRLVRAQRYVETPVGRRRRFPLMMRDTAFLMERKGVNSPVQSLASDICLTNLIYLHRHVLPQEVRIISTVHDSILFLIPEESVEEWIPIIKSTMEVCRALPEGMTFDIPLKVDIKLGKRWGDMREL
jgi:DNA polymerase-1